MFNCLNPCRGIRLCHSGNHCLNTDSCREPAARGRVRDGNPGPRQAAEPSGEGLKGSSKVNSGSLITERGSGPRQQLRGGANASRQVTLATQCPAAGLCRRSPSRNSSFWPPRALQDSNSTQYSTIITAEKKTASVTGTASLPKLKA